MADECREMTGQQLGFHIDGGGGGRVLQRPFCVLGASGGVNCVVVAMVLRNCGHSSSALTFAVPETHLPYWFDVLASLTMSVLVGTDM